jgi:hypothetical protein
MIVNIFRTASLSHLSDQLTQNRTRENERKWKRISIHLTGLLGVKSNSLLYIQRCLLVPFFRRFVDITSGSKKWVLIKKISQDSCLFVEWSEAFCITFACKIQIKYSLDLQTILSTHIVHEIWGIFFSLSLKGHIQHSQQKTI